MKKLAAMFLALAMVVTMLPAALAAEIVPFTDVAADYWAADAIEWTYELGYMKGKTDTTFEPSGNVSRQQVWMVQARMAGNDPANMAEAKAWAMDEGISDGTNPGKAVTRQQLVTMLWRSYGEPAAELSVLDTYPDVNDVASYAKEAMAWSVTAGIIGGTTDGRLDPMGNASRAQFAVILKRFCDWEDQEIVTPDETYTVTFDRKDGTAAKTFAVKAGETVERIGNPYRGGYTFKGWFTAPTGGEKFDFATAIEGDLTLYAQWTKTAYADTHVHTYGDWVSNNDGTHTRTYNCGHEGSETADCGYTYTDEGESGHLKNCSDCGHSAGEAHVYNEQDLCVCGGVKHVHDYVYTPNYDGTHTKTCCETVVEDCSYADGDVCTYCEYDKSAAAMIGDVYYATLADAFAVGGEVVVLKDIALTEGLTIAADKTVVLDLNGKTVSMADASGATAAMIANNGALTIKDSSEDENGENGTGKLTFGTTTPSLNNAYASNTVSNRGILTVEGGSIENTSVGGACYALDNYAGSTATINGGELTAEKTTVRIFDWTNGAESVLNVNGGTILSKDGYGINLNMGNTPTVALNISGGTVTTEDTDYNLAVYVISKGSAENVTINVTGGTLNGNFALNGLTSTTMTAGAISVSGGTIEGVICYDTPAYGFVTGGTFAADPGAYVALGYAATESNGVWTVAATVVNPVAKIGNDLYASLAEAIAAAQDGDTIDVLPGTITERISPWSGDSTHAIEKSITLLGANADNDPRTEAWDETNATILTGGMYLGYDDSKTRDHTIVVKGFTFEGCDLTVFDQKNVTVENNLFTNASGGAILVSDLARDGAEGSAVIRHNVVDGGNVGIEVRRGHDIEVVENVVKNTQDQAIQLTGSVTGTATVEDNEISNWGKNGVSGRALRVVLAGGTLTFTGNVMTNAAAPEEFVKITGTGTVNDLADNTWNGGVVYVIDEFRIYDLAQLKTFRDKVNAGETYSGKTVKLMADIDLNNEEWTPIGNKANPFSGTFDGNGKTVSNLKISGSNDAVGFFGHTTAALKNLTVNNAVVSGSKTVGAISGWAYTGTVTNCHVTGTIQITGNYKVGGITGGDYAKLSNCSVIGDAGSYIKGVYAEADLEGDNIGGIMGFRAEATSIDVPVIENCTAEIDVMGTRKVGGIAGSAGNRVTVVDCEYTGDVSTNASSEYFNDNIKKLFVGGIVGEAAHAGSINITNCTVNAGSTVSGWDGLVGAICGGHRASNATTINVTDCTSNGTVILVIPGTTVTMTKNEGSQNYGTVYVNSKEDLLYLPTLVANWADLFSNGLGTAYSNYAPQNGGKGVNYYYDWTWDIKLTTDIDFGGAEIDPIELGKKSVFDGQGHTIKNAVIKTDSATENGAGLFVNSNCGFINLKLDEIHVTGSNVGNSTAGILVDSPNKAISNITITNSSVTGGKYTGGVVGYNYGSVTDCTLTNCTVKGGYKLGGIIGYICSSVGGSDVTGNTLTGCAVDGIGGGVYAGGKDKYVVGQVVGNYNCDGICNNNTVTGMTTSAASAIGEIEAGKTVTQ